MATLVAATGSTPDPRLPATSSAAIGEPSRVVHDPPTWSFQSLVQSRIAQGEGNQDHAQHEGQLGMEKWLDYSLLFSIT